MGANVYIILTLFSGYGKTFSVRTSLNDQSYIAQMDALFKTMELDKTKTSSPNNNNTATVPTNAGNRKFGNMMYKAPEAWSEKMYQEGVVFKPLDVPADEYLSMQIMQPLNFSGSIEEALQKSYDETAAMYKGTS